MSDPTTAPKGYVCAACNHSITVHRVTGCDVHPCPCEVPNGVLLTGDPDPIGPTGVWPLTSERDAHLGAWSDGIAAWEYGRRKAEMEAIAPAPAGLTAAQEIRLNLAQAILYDGIPIVDTLDEFVQRVGRVVTGVAVMVEHGPDETPTLREQAASLAQDTADEAAAWLNPALFRAPVACPDPAIHDADLREAERVAKLQAERCPHPALHADEGIKRLYEAVAEANAAAAQAETRLADLKTELLEAHADLEASLAREQIAATAIRSAEARIAELEQQRDKVLGYVADLEQGLSDDGRDLPPGFKHIRAFLAGDQGTYAHDAHCNTPHKAGPEPCPPARTEEARADG